MTDEFDRLRAALQAAPAPDADAKAAAIALAMKNFDALPRAAQGSATELRPDPDRPSQAGFRDRIRTMFARLTGPQALLATSSIAALCVAVVVTQTQPPRIIPAPVGAPETQVAPKHVVTPTTDIPAPAQPDRTRSTARAADAAPAQATATPPVAKKAPAVIADEPAPVVTAMPEASAMMTAEAPMADLTTRAAPPVAAAPMTVPEGMLTQEVGSVEMEQGFEDASADQLRYDTDALQAAPPESTEAFANAPANPIRITAEEPVSTFSIDVDTASYAVIRNSLNAGTLPPPEAVRIEEMINYFPYAYPTPEADGPPFRPTVSVMPTPWNDGTRLVRIGIQGRMPALADRPPLHLVFLIDTSGSMDEPAKLPLLKQSLALMLGQLRPQDQVAIVAYAGSAGTVLEPTEATDRDAILSALDNLAAGGSTAGAEGLALAYQVAETMAASGEVSRILLATDGDFNVGVDTPEGLEAYVAKQREGGTYLSVLGFGRGNLDDATMQALAQNGNGTAAYIDTLEEGRKVLSDQLTGALFSIADDVKIQVEWNPAQVAEYRLIGYETRALRREDFSNDRIDAGEIGAGTGVTALYEITAPDSPALRNEPLRYGTAATTPTGGELGFLRLRWKAPGEATSQLVEQPITDTGTAPDDDARFAAAIAGFGQLLTSGTYLGDWGWDQAIQLALGARGEDAFGYRIQAVNLMRTAQTLSVQ